MNLTMWRVVGFFSMHTKFRENSLQETIFSETSCALRATTTLHVVSLTDFYFHFLANFQT